jgi:hypothetical protein
LFINRFLKKTTVHENRKTEDNFAPESTHGILNTNRRQFFFFRNSILQQAIEKASTKIEQKYNSDLSIRKATFDGFSESS